MNCQKCIHSNVCKFTDKEVCKGTKVNDLEHDCKDYVESIVEVVRCKDCKYWDISSSCYGDFHICKIQVVGLHQSFSNSE